MSLWLTLHQTLWACRYGMWNWGKQGTQHLKNDKDWFIFRTCAHKVCVFGMWSFKGSVYQYPEFILFSPLCFSDSSYYPHSFLPVCEPFSPPAGHSHADDASAPNKRLWQPQWPQQRDSPDRSQHPPAPHLHIGGCSGCHENKSLSAHITQHQIIAQVIFSLTCVPPANCINCITAFIPGMH